MMRTIKEKNMRRWLEPLCFIAVAAICTAPGVFAAPAELLQDACALGPAEQSSDPPRFQEQTALGEPGDPALLSATESSDASASDPTLQSEEVTTLMNMHHLMAHEMTHTLHVQPVQTQSPLRDALGLLDAVTGLKQHLPGRLRALVYDTDEPPAVGAWSAKWDAPAANAESALLSSRADLLAPVQAAWQVFHSLFDTPSPRQAHAAATPAAAAAAPEPDGWAMLLAGVLGIGAMARLRLFA
jgi:hypothetical protein